MIDLGGSMKYEQMNNNKVILSGKVISEPVFSHETFGEGFYDIELSVPRLSEHCDIVPVTVSEKLMTKEQFAVGKNVSIKGQGSAKSGTLKRVDG